MSDSLEVKVDTGGDDVHHPYTAFNQGFEAFDSGFPKECNPYDDDSLKAWWDTGWDEAKEQDDESY
jgi:ribosome modulation factor